MITLDEATRLAAEVMRAAIDQDHEKAHGLEDQLRARVLYAIERGAQPADKLAAIALLTDKLPFRRNCA